MRYEVGVSIISGNIVWINGSFECGPYSDFKSFKKLMRQFLLVGELIVADNVYVNTRCFNFKLVGM